MEVVKAGMGHGDLSMEAYCQVWEECYGQVNIPLPNVGKKMICPGDRLSSSHSPGVRAVPGY